MFYFCHASGFVLAFIYLWFMAQCCGLDLRRALAVFVLSYASSYVWMLALKRIITGFGGQNAVRIIVFIPLFIYVYSKLLKLDFNRMLDFGAAAPMISFGIGKFGCVFGGCCESWLEVEWGMYNGWVNKTLFPVQLFEALTAVLIALWTMWYVKKHNYDTGARAISISYIAFGVTRFGWEFLRNNKKLFLGISELAFWALAAAILGAVLLVKTGRKNRKNTACEHENILHSTDS